MRDWQNKRYWIVGASEGLGREVARKVSGAGAHVILSARSTERLEDLGTELTGASTIVPCDVQDAEDVKRAAAEAGEIDGLIYLAGVYWPQGVAEWNAEQVISMIDINLTGAARVLGEVVPSMVARDAGHIVLTGSLSGFRGLPKSIGYGASKAGLIGLAEAMHADLRTTGVDVQLVNPGFIKTRLTDKNEFRMPFIMSPRAAADQVMDHMSGDTFVKNFPLPLSSGLKLMNFLPDWLYYRIVGS